MKLRHISPPLAAIILASLLAAMPAGADTDRDERRVSLRLEACLEQAAQKFDYDDAARVVHWLYKIDQTGLDAADLRIKTEVYPEDDTAVREYETHCATGMFGKVVRIKVTSLS